MRYVSPLSPVIGARAGRRNHKWHNIVSSEVLQRGTAQKTVSRFTKDGRRIPSLPSPHKKKKKKKKKKWNKNKNYESPSPPRPFLTSRLDVVVTVCLPSLYPSGYLCQARLRLLLHNIHHYAIQGLVVETLHYLSLVKSQVHQLHHAAANPGDLLVPQGDGRGPSPATTVLSHRD